MLDRVKAAISIDWLAARTEKLTSARLGVVNQSRSQAFDDGSYAKVGLLKRIEF